MQWTKAKTHAVSLFLVAMNTRQLLVGDINATGSRVETSKVVLVLDRAALTVLPAILLPVVHVLGVASD